MLLIVILVVRWTEHDQTVGVDQPPGTYGSDLRGGKQVAAAARLIRAEGEAEDAHGIADNHWGLWPATCRRILAAR